MIGMTKVITHVGDILPGYAGMPLFVGFRNVSRRLADDFEKALEGGSRRPVLQVSGCFSVKQRANVGDGLRDVFETLRKPSRH